MADDNALTVGELTSSQTIPLSPLLTAANASLRLIEPWRRAQYVLRWTYLVKSCRTDDIELYDSSDHPALIPIIAGVQRQGEAYYDGLDLSIKTAENAYTFSTDAVDLCNALLNPDYSVEELQQFIDDMRELAQDARDDALNTSNVFRSVRERLNQVRRDQFFICISLADLRTHRSPARYLLT